MELPDTILIVGGGVFGCKLSASRHDVPWIDSVVLPGSIYGDSDRYPSLPCKFETCCPNIGAGLYQTGYISVRGTRILDGNNHES
jgi:hypothetical protein